MTSLAELTHQLTEFHKSEALKSRSNSSSHSPDSPSSLATHSRDKESQLLESLLRLVEFNPIQNRDKSNQLVEFLYGLDEFFSLFVTSKILVSLKILRIIFLA